MSLINNYLNKRDKSISIESTTFEIRLYKSRTFKTWEEYIKEYESRTRMKVPMDFKTWCIQNNSVENGVPLIDYTNGKKVVATSDPYLNGLVEYQSLKDLGAFLLLNGRTPAELERINKYDYVGSPWLEECLIIAEDYDYRGVYRCYLAIECNPKSKDYNAVYLLLQHEQNHEVIYLADNFINYLESNTDNSRTIKKTTVTQYTYYGNINRNDKTWVDYIKTYEKRTGFKVPQEFVKWANSNKTATTPVLWLLEEDHITLQPGAGVDPIGKQPWQTFKDVGTWYYRNEKGSKNADVIYRIYDREPFTYQNYMIFAHDYDYGGSYTAYFALDCDPKSKYYGHVFLLLENPDEANLLYICRSFNDYINNNVTEKDIKKLQTIDLLKLTVQYSK